jgi:hypothetical protein
MNRPVLLLCILAGLLSVSITAHAAGRIEIYQAAVNIAGGFPYTISVPRSYVLMGDLDVGSDDVTGNLDFHRSGHTRSERFPDSGPPFVQSGSLFTRNRKWGWGVPLSLPVGTSQCSAGRSADLVRTV